MNLLKAVFSVSALTLVSRITGMVRETLVAGLFGATALSDAFQVAFRLPNLLRRLFAEGAFSQAFVPLLAATRAQEGDEATHRLVDAVATVLLWVLTLTCVVGVVFAPALVWVLASGLAEEGRDAAIVMARWMFPYIGFISLVALAAGILNTWKRFAVPAATPVLLNLAVIAGAWLGVPLFRHWGIPTIYALAAGVMLGGVLQLAVQYPALKAIGFVPHLGFTPRAFMAAWRHDGVHRILKQMAPALLGVSVAQLSLLINLQIASHVGEGAVSCLTYADRLMELPTALLGVALGVVLTPQLSATQARGETDEYAALLDWGLRLVVMLAVPCAAALLVFAQPMVATLYHRGAFTPAAVQQTTAAVMGYGVGLIGLVGLKVVTPGYYARQDMRTPVQVAILVLVLTQVMNAIFVPWLGVAGLSLAIGLGAVLNMTVLLVGLHRRGSFRAQPGWGLFLARVVAATALMGAAMAWAATHLDWLALGRHEAQRAGAMALALGASAAIYFAALALSGLNLRQFVRRG